MVEIDLLLTGALSLKYQPYFRQRNVLADEKNAGIIFADENIAGFIFSSEKSGGTFSLAKIIPVVFLLRKIMLAKFFVTKKYQECLSVKVFICA